MGSCRAMQKWPRENCPKRFLGGRAIRRNIHLSTAGIEIEGCARCGGALKIIARAPPVQ